MSDLLLPTTVVGSHAYPGWFFTALEEIEQGRYGQHRCPRGRGRRG